MKEGTTTAWVEMLGGEIRYYRANGIRTRCLEAGEGEPLILLHGLGGHAEAYLKNILPLSERFHVYAIDLVGHGLTDKPALDYTIADFATHVTAFLDAIGASSAHVQGESLGGWIAAWLAIERPDRVRKLILNTTAGLRITEQEPQVEGEGVARLRRLTDEAVTNPTRETVRRRLAWLFHDPSKSLTDELVEVRYRIYRQPETAHALRATVAQITGEARQRYALTPERLARIQALTLVLWTRHNPTTPWEVGQQAHRLIPGSKFQVMEDCGHWPQWEKAAEFNGIVTDFLAA